MAELPVVILVNSNRWRNAAEILTRRAFIEQRIQSATHVDLHRFQFAEVDMQMPAETSPVSWLLHVFE